MNEQLRADLLCRLEQEQARHDAFVLVALNDDGRPLTVTGPFTEPEQALAQAGIDDADWQQAGGDGALQFSVLPLWEPT